MFSHAPDRVLLLLCLSSGFALRIFGLGRKSLWLDEAWSWYIARTGYGAFGPEVADPYHPPLYYWLLSTWIAMGESEWILRFPSAFFATATIAMAYQLGKCLGDRQIALTAALLSAYSPLLVWYGQEARSYSLLAFLGTAAILAMCRWLQAPRLRWGMLFLVATSAASYTHYGAFLLLPLQLALVVVLLALGQVRFPAVVMWIGGWIVIGLVYWPWMRSPAVQEFVHAVLADDFYVAHMVYDRYGVSLANVTWLLWPVVVLGAGVALSLLYWSSGRYTRRLTQLGAHPGIQTGLLVGFIVLLVVSVAPRGYSLKRQVVMLWPLLLVLFAWFWPWTRTDHRLLTGVLTCSIIAAVMNVALVPKDEWREVAHYLETHSRPGDVVWLLPETLVIPLDYYGQAGPQWIGVSAATPPDPLRGALNSSLQPAFFIYQPGDAVPMDAKQRIVDWLEQHLTPVDEASFFRIKVIRYESRNHHRAPLRLASHRLRRAVALPGPLLLPGLARHQSPLCPVRARHRLGCHSASACGQRCTFTQFACLAADR